MVKYLLILITDMFRQRLLEIASTLMENGRLDDKQQIFDLHLDEVERALSDPSLDLRALAQKNTRFLQKLRRVRSMPSIVDSRGKIFRRPPRMTAEGDLVGQSISPGVAKGPVKGGTSRSFKFSMILSR